MHSPSHPYPTKCIQFRELCKCWKCECSLRLINGVIWFPQINKETVEYLSYIYKLFIDAQKVYATSLIYIKLLSTLLSTIIQWLFSQNKAWVYLTEALVLTDFKINPGCLISSLVAYCTTILHYSILEKKKLIKQQQTLYLCFLLKTLRAEKNLKKKLI